ncbi:MAG: hypothetical protein FWB96_09850 [Defluviitaleaceae bacterium]|nr:hypothetical protein [Defluviitaleaceae bacterium]MCL2263178.1 hypothetical protein [Defluviitaleaceae bacterium]
MDNDKKFRVTVFAVGLSCIVAIAAMVTIFLLATEEYIAGLYIPVYAEAPPKEEPAEEEPPEEEPAEEPPEEEPPKEEPEEAPPEEEPAEEPPKEEPAEEEPVDAPPKEEPTEEPPEEAPEEEPTEAPPSLQYPWQATLRSYTGEITGVTVNINGVPVDATYANGYINFHLFSRANDIAPIVEAAADTVFIDLSTMENVRTVILSRNFLRQTAMGGEGAALSLQIQMPHTLLYFSQESAATIARHARNSEIFIAYENGLLMYSMDVVRPMSRNYISGHETPTS